jgi:hypothetical protein
MIRIKVSYPRKLFQEAGMFILVNYKLWPKLMAFDLIESLVEKYNLQLGEEK